MTALPSIAQASADAGHGMFVSTSLGTMLEGRGSAPLTLTGRSLAIAVGWLIPGGSVFLWELGLRGEVIVPGDGFVGEHVARGISAFAGVRVELLQDPVVDTMPVLRAGFSASLVRDVREKHPRATSIPGRVLADDRVSLGPHLALGVEREVWFGTSIGVFVESHALIAPLTTSVALSISVSAQGL